MFQYLKGKIEEIHKDSFIIEVNNIGYKVYAPASTLDGLKKIEGIQKVYTYVHVKEDGWTIYGFLTREELDTFELLISISGVGPKVANGILSACSPSRFAMLIAGSDVKSLSKLPGIGAKTSQRIILELKDKIDMEDLLGAESFKDQGIKAGENKVVDEAVEAMISLGYSVQEAKDAVSHNYKDGQDVDVVIKNALAYIYTKH